MTAPWSALNDDQLGIIHTEKNEEYATTPPWNKLGAKKFVEEKRNRETYDALKHRRVENVQRDKAIQHNSSKETHEVWNLTKKNQAERSRQSLEEQKEYEGKRSEEKARRHALRCELRARKRAERDSQREKTLSEEKQKVRNLSKLTKQLREQEHEEREAHAEQVKSMLTRTRESCAERRRERLEYRNAVKEELFQKKRLAAKKMREERIERERVAKEMREAHVKKRPQTPFWNDDTIDNSFEEARISKSELLAAKQQEETQNDSDRRASIQELRKRIAAMRASEREDAQKQDRIRRSEVNATLMRHQLNASERRQRDEEEFYDRNIAPLERRSKFGKERRSFEHQEEIEGIERRSGEFHERRQRLAQAKQAERDVHKQPFVLG